ncbi:MAG: restriction endonuclease subunit S, partial [Anaerococcus sp.]|nr:restriction endonuclease subunit S [Anaerococcus sp.]
MNKIVSVPIDDIFKEKRFNPKYFYFLENRNIMLESNKNNIDFEYLGNEDYITVLTDGIHSTVDFDKNSGIKYLYVSNLNDGFIDITDNNFLSRESLNDNPSKVLLNKDVLLSVVGRVGETALMSGYVDYETSLPRNIAFMRTNNNKLLPEFLTCYFLSDFARQQCVYSGGGNLQKLISLTKLRKFVFPVVKMEIQEEFGQLYNRA